MKLSTQIACAAALAAGLGVASGSSLADDVVGVIKSIHGNVLIERAGTTLKPVRGSEVLNGDRVITGSDGVATIAMRRAAPVSIGPQNDVSVDRFSAGDIPVVKRAAPPILQSLASFLAINKQR